MVSIEDASTGMDCVTYGRLAPRCEFGWFPCLAFTVNCTPKRATLARGTYWNPTRACSYFCQSAWRRRKFAGKRDPNQTSRLERSKIRCSAIDWSDLFHQETVVYEESTPLCVVQVPTSPIPGQKTGTSGIRKRTREVTQTPNFFENWFQSLFDVLVERYGRTSLNRATLVVGGDGREGNQAALRTLLRIAAANSLQRLIVLGPDAIATTPAISAAIRAAGALGGIALTASHNPGGADGDWGVKYNMENGGPAPDSFTSLIYERTLTISRYLEVEASDPEALCGRDGFDGVNFKRIQTVHRFRILPEGARDALQSPNPDRLPHSDGGRTFEIHLVDATATYVELMEGIFHFERLRALLRLPNFNMVYDAMYGSTGPFAFMIFGEKLGYWEYPWFRRGQYLPDFGGVHPEPNLENLADLVAEFFSDEDSPDFGAASDADGDRYLILGRKFVVQPSDSLAIMLDYALRPDFAAYCRFDGGLIRGVARSMPTSSAVDVVASRHNIRCYETPTGWKYFCNLLDAGLVSLCGEESCGAGGAHIREKDGLWAILFWLSILAYHNLQVAPGSKSTSVEDIVRAHWAHYGRNYYERWDFHGIERTTAERWMRNLERSVEGGEILSLRIDGPQLYAADVFHYQDPVDGSWARNQGVRLFFSSDRRMRAVLRLSGTSSADATLRVYLEKYVAPNDGDVQAVGELASSFVADIGRAALLYCGIVSELGRERPDLRA